MCHWCTLKLRTPIAPARSRKRLWQSRLRRASRTAPSLSPGGSRSHSCECMFDTGRRVRLPSQNSLRASVTVEAHPSRCLARKASRLPDDPLWDFGRTSALAGKDVQHASLRSVYVAKQEGGKGPDMRRNPSRAALSDLTIDACGPNGASSRFCCCTLCKPLRVLPS